MESPKASNPRACLQCQKRKTKCVFRGMNPDACIYCTKTHKRCIFEAPPSRTPLTRKNLDAVERRCAQLEAQLRALDPNLKLETSLEGDDREISEEPPLPTDARESSPGEDYEWNEAEASNHAKPANVENDGMATISTAASGYLGESLFDNIRKQLT